MSSSPGKLTGDSYLSWKAQTLAMQTSHKEEQQKTGLWQDFNDVNVVEKNISKDRNEFEVELAPGWRWGKYKHNAFRLVGFILEWLIVEEWWQHGAVLSIKVGSLLVSL